MKNDVKNQEKWFSEENIHGIARSDNNCNEVRKILSRHKSEIEEFIKDTEFKPKNISSILHHSVDGGGTENVESLLTALLKRKDDIVTILSETDFDVHNVSSILGSSRNSETLNKSVDTLLGNIEKINNFVSDGSFSAHNISSILSQGKENTEKLLEITLKHQDDLTDMVKNGRFSASQITSILHRSGCHLQKNLDFLLKTENKKKIDSVMETVGFTSNDFVTIMQRAEGGLITKVSDLYRHKDKLKEICDRNVVSPSDLAKALETVKTDEFARTIINLYDKKTTIETAEKPSSKASNVIHIGNNEKPKISGAIAARS